ncbi:MAG TPA: VWA domain-containing protein [Kiritimatiellia bacterium]|nr:VWA domain-containing protein [Kiritimatiellia bacterium]
MRTLHKLIISILIPTCVQAAGFPEAVFILDGSGSMQGPAGAQTKMDAAKSVMEKVVPEVPPEVRIGLAAYGHRRAKDCTDIEVLIPPGSADRDGLLARVKAIQPTGMTPIAAAVTQVADLLKGRTAETTIVLVSDGKETCGGDPCATVKALKTAGVNFIMHVVGFDVTDEDKVQLSCIAEAGGGQYFDAADPAALLAAFETVRKEIEQKVEKAKSSTVQKVSGLGKLRIAMPESALKSLSGFRITRKSDGKVVKEAELPGADSTHPLMSGDYSLTLLFANPNYRPPTEVALTDFTVAKGEVAEVLLGDLVFNMAEELNDLSVSAIIISESATGREVLKVEPNGNDYYLFKPKALPAGTYDVSFLYYRSPSPTKVAGKIDVAAGKEAYVTLDSGIVLVKPAETSVQGWDLIPSGNTTPLLSVRRGFDNQEPLWRQFIVPPGTYDVMVTVKGMDEPLPAGEGVEIKKGETLRFETGL